MALFFILQNNLFSDSDAKPVKYLYSAIILLTSGTTLMTAFNTFNNLSKPRFHLQLWQVCAFLDLLLHLIILAAYRAKEQESETVRAEGCFLEITSIIQSNVSPTPGSPWVSKLLTQSCHGFNMLYKSVWLKSWQLFSFVSQVDFTYLIGLRRHSKQKMHCAVAQLIPNPAWFYNTHQYLHKYLLKQTVHFYCHVGHILCRQ